MAEPPEETVVSVLRLVRGLVTVLVAEGVAHGDATATARFLIEGTARGYREHGVERIFQILDGFRQGTLRPRGDPRTVRSTAATVLIDADHTLGQPVGRYAARAAVRLACRYGVGVAGVRNAGHLGVLAPYAELVAAAGCLGIVASSTSPAAVAAGGGEAVLGTNPIAYAAPLPHGTLVADFATTATTRGHVLRQRDMGNPLAAGLAVDLTGAPTTDPAAALAGGLLPLGGNVKGSLLGLLVAVLTGPLLGAATNVDVVGTRTMDRPPNKGDVFIAFDPAAFTAPELFRDTLLRQVDTMGRTSPVFRVPGARSTAWIGAALRSGIPISPELARLLGV